ncbi:MAG TPA: DUF262 domain-containing protein [Chitinophagales bacterium]|nr:DUF262 domain-containing protein [Chitinophagales bacterium]
MEVKELNKSIREIFQSNYIVPLYQRNYAWTDEEIHQLIRDIYENYKKDPNGFYFIGTLVVLKRKNGDFEVIDGQQRLTTLSLIAKKLDNSLHTSKLQYDSRPEVESFLSTYYQRGEVEMTTTNHLVSHFNEAIDYIETVNLETDPSKTLHFIDFLNDGRINEFKEYFFNQVQIVKVEIPSDTDVAHYFEVMNNRGEQLEEHEIIKAQLLSKIKDNRNASLLFSKIWDACSQMNVPIQRLFNKEDRERFFGSEYNSFEFDSDGLFKDNKSTIINSSLSLEKILKGDSILKNNEIDENEIDEKFESIIDFPNFLMHVLKQYFSNIEEKDIPLNGDELLNQFDDLEKEIIAMDFIYWLFFYRVVFDRFIVKVIEDENSEDNTKWILHKPEYYYYEKKKTHRLIFKNSFEEYQEPIIKCLSMLQVTFRTKKYKNYLQEILSWFEDASKLEMSDKDFLSKLNELVLKTYDDNKDYLNLVKDLHYNEGTKTPHFLFNFIDYLYWTENKKAFNFEFKYRNSVEHHLPQSYINEENKDILDCLGNLCLVSKSGNSKMNNESPIGKADKNGKYYKSTLAPKQLVMYDITNKKGKWGVNEILNHYTEVIELLDRRVKILK